MGYLKKLLIVFNFILLSINAVFADYGKLDTRKVVFLGSYNEGKTSFIRAIRGMQTDGVAVNHTTCAELAIDYQIILDDGRYVLLKLEDYPGDMVCRDALPSFVKSVDWAFICVGMQDKLDGSTFCGDKLDTKRTMESCVTGWIDFVKNNTGKKSCQIVIVKTKIDMGKASGIYEELSDEIDKVVRITVNNAWIV